MARGTPLLAASAAAHGSDAYAARRAAGKAKRPPLVLSTDGGGVMHTSVPREVNAAQTLVDRFLQGGADAPRLGKPSGGAAQAHYKQFLVRAQPRDASPEAYGPEHLTDVVKQYFEQFPQHLRAGSHKAARLLDIHRDGTPESLPNSATVSPVEARVDSEDP
jgi:hypothetical protein